MNCKISIMKTCGIYPLLYNDVDIEYLMRRITMIEHVEITGKEMRGKRCSSNVREYRRKLGNSRRTV